MDRGFAPAKVNLALHVTGLRHDGYHLLDSLVVFAGVGDQLAASRAPGLSLSISGAFAAGLSAGPDNLVLRAATALIRARGLQIGAALRLVKSLPTAAGIGGGSSDAAATLRLLADLWQVAPLSPSDPAVLALGADVPVCMAAPMPQRMSGIGERLSEWPALPACALVLVNPGVAVPTRDVFARLAERQNPPMSRPETATDYAGFLGWLRDQRNDLEGPARSLTPEIDRTLARLSALPGVDLARMSGSGATCFGLCRDMASARRAAQALQIAEQGWWVAPAPVLGRADAPLDGSIPGGSMTN